MSATHHYFCPEYKDILESAFNVLGYFNILNYDQDFDRLAEELKNLKKDQFDFKDRFVFTHFDLDFYLPGCQVGTSIYNFYQTLLDCSIPLSTVLFITNHHGIEREFKILCQYRDTTLDYLTFIYNLGDVNQSYQNYIEHSVEFNVDKETQNITKLGLALMGEKRPHRNALLQFILKNNLQDKIAISYNNQNPND